MTVKERLAAFVKSKGISQSAFCRSIGVSNAFISSMRKSLQPDKIEIIALNYPDLNINWLLTGEGIMLNNDLTKTYNVMDEQTKLLNHLMSEIEYLRKKLDESESERKELRSMCDKMIEETKELRLLTTFPAQPKKKEAS